MEANAVRTDRRRYSRVSAPIPARVTAVGDEAPCFGMRSVILVDFSEGGVQFRSPVPLTPGGRFRLAFVPPMGDEEVEADIEVLHVSSDGVHAGVYFMHCMFVEASVHLLWRIVVSSFAALGDVTMARRLSRLRGPHALRTRRAG